MPQQCSKYLLATVKLSPSLKFLAIINPIAEWCYYTIDDVIIRLKLMLLYDWWCYYTIDDVIIRLKLMLLYDYLHTQFQIPKTSARIRVFSLRVISCHLGRQSFQYNAKVLKVGCKGKFQVYKNPTKRKINIYLINIYII